MLRLRRCRYAGTAANNAATGTERATKASKALAQSTMEMTEKADMARTVMTGLTDSFVGLTISAMDWWAAAAKFSTIPTAFTSPQEGPNGEGSPGWFFDQIRAAEDADINANLSGTGSGRPQGMSLGDWKTWVAGGSDPNSPLLPWNRR